MKTKDVVMQEVDGYTPVYRVYKDRVFRMLFKEKERLLELYNALNKTAYTDETELTCVCMSISRDIVRTCRFGDFYILLICIKSISGTRS